MIEYYHKAKTKGILLMSFKKGDKVTSNHPYIAKPKGIITGIQKDNEYPFVVKRDADKTTYRAREFELILL